MHHHWAVGVLMPLVKETISFEIERHVIRDGLSFNYGDTFNLSVSSGPPSPSYQAFFLNREEAIELRHGLSEFLGWDD